jgi:F-type H+-transporting ATPase subunit b
MALEHTPDITEAVTHAAAQASFVSTLGIDPMLLVAQLINFSIIVFVLWRWGYKPLVGMMDARTTRIEEGIANADKAVAELARTQEEREKMIVETKKEARVILEEAALKVEAEREATLAQTKIDATKIVTDAKVMIERAREKMIVDVRTDVADLVLAATEKILEDKMTEKKDAALIESAVRAVSKQ